jgi:hypothetical protein
MTDYKQLCAELYGIFEKYDDESNLAGIYWDMEKAGNDVLDRARAALAEPEPEKQSVAATALRAAVDQVVPDQGDIWTRDLRGDAWIRWEERKLIRREILAIAAELKAQ